MSKIQLRFQYYSSWFLVNFVLCLLPIGILILIKGAYENDTFLSFLSYSYTLLISAIYLFDYVRVQEKSQFLFWTSISVTVLLLIFYCLFPTSINSRFNAIIVCNLNKISYIILSTIIFLSFFLNKDEIEKKVNKKYNELKMAKSREATNNYSDFKKQVNDGISN